MMNRADKQWHKRNQHDRSRRLKEIPQQKEARLDKRRHSERSKRLKETAQQKEGID